MSEKRVIEGKPYELSGPIWYPCDTLGPLYCECGSDHFRVIYTDFYETTAECVECGKREVVHDG